MSDRSYAVASAAHSLRRTIQDAEEKLRTLQLIPHKDDFSHGAAIRVVVRPRYGNDDPLTYLLLKVIDVSLRGDNLERWYFTGSLFGRGHVDHNQQGHLRWDQFVSWLINDVVLESWEELVPRAAPATSDGVVYHDDRA